MWWEIGKKYQIPYGVWFFLGQVGFGGDVQYGLKGHFGLNGHKGGAEWEGMAEERCWYDW